MKVAGKSVFALYLIPDGYKVMDDENGYTVVVPKDAKPDEAAPDLDEE